MHIPPARVTHWTKAGGRRQQTLILHLVSASPPGCMSKELIPLIGGASACDGKKTI